MGYDGRDRAAARCRTGHASEPSKYSVVYQSVYSVPTAQFPLQRAAASSTSSVHVHRPPAADHTHPSLTHSGTRIKDTSGRLYPYKYKPRVLQYGTSVPRARQPDGLSVRHSRVHGSCGLQAGSQAPEKAAVDGLHLPGSLGCVGCLDLPGFGLDSLDLPGRSPADPCPTQPPTFHSLLTSMLTSMLPRPLHRSHPRPRESAVAEYAAPAQVPQYLTDYQRKWKQPGPHRSTPSATSSRPPFQVFMQHPPGIRLAPAGCDRMRIRSLVCDPRPGISRRQAPI